MENLASYLDQLSDNEINKDLAIYFAVYCIEYDCNNESISNLHQKWFRFKLKMHQEEIVNRLRNLGYLVVESKVCDLHLDDISDDRIEPCMGSSFCSHNKHSIFFISMVDNLKLGEEFDINEELEPYNFIL